MLSLFLGVGKQGRRGSAAGREETRQQGNGQASYALPATHDGRMPVFTRPYSGKLLDERAHDGVRPGCGWPAVVGRKGPWLGIGPSSVGHEGGWARTVSESKKLFFGGLAECLRRCRILVFFCFWTDSGTSGCSGMVNQERFMTSFPALPHASC